MPTTRPIAQSIRTLDIGDELARLIGQKASGPLRLSRCECSIEDPPANAPLAKFIPGVVIRPEESEIEPSTLGQQDLRYTETYWIGYGFEPRTNRPSSEIISALKLLMQGAGSDNTLSAISQDIAPDQIESSLPLAILWNPPEDVLFFPDLGAEVKVVALRWQVVWLSRTLT